MIEQNCVNILSFDLGSVYGWSYSSFINNNKYLVKDGGTVNLSLMIKNNPALFNVVDEKRKRLIIFESQITKLLTSFQIDVIVAEDIFMEFNRPQAFQSLLLYMETLERVVFQYRCQPIVKIPSTHVKLILTGDGHADKEEIQTAMKNNLDIEIKKASILKDMSSHLSDSICIGFTLAKSLSSTIF